MLAAHQPDAAHPDLLSGGSLSTEGFLDVRPARVSGRGMLSAPPQSTQVIRGPQDVHFVSDTGPWATGP